LLLELGNLRTIRAAEILFQHGRAAQGYGLLRDLKDRAILLGAVGNRFTTLSVTSGVETSPGISDDFVAYTCGIKKRRKKAEADAWSRMIGAKSDLSPDARRQLQKWEELFHMEVHGARITSVFEDEGWTKGEVPLPIIPKPNMDMPWTYINRFREVCWMVLRTFPMLQLEPGDFGYDWADKWRVLDESFLFIVDGLRKQGKEIAAAIIELVSKRFALGPESAYPPEDATVQLA
jgi:hypothetical protein